MTDGPLFPEPRRQPVPGLRALRRWLSVRGCLHDGPIVPLRYHVIERGVVVELGECERCGARVAR